MMERYEEPKGHILTGIIGALVGALLGAVVWVLVGKLGYIASIVGFLIAFLASKGYDLCKGRPGTIKLVVLLVCVVLAVAVGTAGTYLWIAHDMWVEETSELSAFERSLLPSEAELFREIIQDSEVQTEFFKDLAMGLLFGALGAFGMFKGLSNKNQAQPVAQPIEGATSSDNSSTADTTQNDDSAAV